MGQAEDWVEKNFPTLKATKAYAVTSPRTGDYNCIAWAADINNEWWWPDQISTWPADLPRENTLANFVVRFQRLRYEICDSFDLEGGFEKVAIYTKDGKPTHMAKQLPNGAWTSKLGKGWDIQHHVINGVDSPVYGAATCVMRRPIGQFLEATFAAP